MPRNSTLDAIIDAQCKWAQGAGLTVDDRGYLPTWQENLRQTMSPPTWLAFDQGDGSELEGRGTSPAKMRALHSSSALAVNAFDYWSAGDCAPLTSALEMDEVAGPLAFERKFKTGLRGNPPNLDVVLPLTLGITFAIESKFTEWVKPKSGSKPPFKEKYFESDEGVWRNVGLPECQSLAQDVQDGIERFIHLDAPQLLKHALGLTKQTGQEFMLCYLYFDWPSPESDIHRHEVGRFASRVGTEVRFRSMTYQDLFARLRRTCGPEHVAYLGYLLGRYAGEAIPDDVRGLSAGKRQ
jgi:hypothetical protein